MLVLWVCASLNPAVWRCQQNEEGWFQMQDVTAMELQWLAEVAPGVFERRG